MVIDPRTVFGLRLIEVRKEKGWSQERLALESGLARSYLGGVERGQRNIALLNVRESDKLCEKAQRLHAHHKRLKRATQSCQHIAAICTQSCHHL